MKNSTEDNYVPPFSEEEAMVLIERVQMALAMTIPHEYEFILVGIPVCKCKEAKNFSLAATTNIGDIVKFLVYGYPEHARNALAEHDANVETDKLANAPFSTVAN